MTVCSQEERRAWASSPEESKMWSDFSSLLWWLEVCCIRCWDVGGAYQGAPGQEPPRDRDMPPSSDSEGLCCVRQRCWIRRFLPIQFYLYNAFGEAVCFLSLPSETSVGLGGFSLGSVPSSGLSGSDKDCCSCCKPLQVLWELALSPKEIIFSPPSEVNIRVTSDHRKNLAHVK